MFYKASLEAKGFAPDARDRWIRLGAFRVEGLLPTSRQIEARQHSAATLASIAAQGNLTEQGQTLVKGLIDRIEEAATWCIDDHPAAKKERLAIKNDHTRVDQWPELGAI
jgi:hypothetical protein